ncbi:MAG: phospho-sugar mutase [Ruminococcaceae bacterium]|nr:phospho-sugar mutase [Oscillospiraceae bacterium]
MNDINKLYSLWCEKATEKEVLDELKSVEGNEKEILDRFWQNLTFGTGGLRGVLGAGTNRMNVYTVSQATQGLADYLNEAFSSPSVAVGYDSRINSDKFARAAASVLAANGIKVYIFKELMPTPIVAYAVKELGCSSGIVITASHNPSKYNGYKCYDERGYQMTDEAAERTLQYINKCDIFDDVKTMDFEKGVEDGIIEFIEDSFLDKYFSLVLSRSINPETAKNTDLSVIYTPLNGTGNKPVRKILSMMGIKDVTVVPVQENPDGRFPTCSFPNPEIRDAFNEALKLTENKKADLLLATDPDCDRVGIAVLTNGEYKLLTGNDVGCLLVDYILSEKKKKGTLCESPVIIKSIVSSDMATAVAESHGAEVRNVLTGFKYIGELMTALQEKGEENRFELGFEESYGYLSGMHTKDKDAVNASMLICEMAAFYKQQCKTLVDVMNELYERFGFWNNALFNFGFEGADGMKKMLSMMDSLRNGAPEKLGGKVIAGVEDYKTGKALDVKTGETKALDFPSSNVIIFVMENKDKVIIRPSGTEPKIKIYAMVQGENEAAAKAQTEEYKKDIMSVLGIGE